MARLNDQRWVYGQQKQLLEIVNKNRKPGERKLVRQNFSHYIRGTASTSTVGRCDKVMARRIANAAQEMGLYITIKDIRYPETSYNPLVRGKARGRNRYKTQQEKQDDKSKM